MATRRDRTPERVADEAIDRLRDIEAGAQLQLRVLLSRLDTERGSSSLLTDAEAKRNAQTVLRQVQAEIDRLRRDVTAAAEDAVAEAAQIEHFRLRGDVPFEPSAAQAIDDAVADRFAEIEAVFGDARREVARAVRVASTTGAPLGQLMQEAADALGSSVGQARSAVDSATMASGRVALVEDTEAIAEATDADIVYVYAGPVDAITRPFCLEHATSVTNAVYVPAYFSTADNGSGQPKPVIAYLGGYNCRHRLAPITRAEAMRRGHVVMGDS